MTRQHFVARGRKSVLIGATIHSQFGHCLLGSHVRWRAEGDTCLGQSPRFARCKGDPEIGYQGVTLA
jgi:hypothetical protein